MNNILQQGDFFSYLPNEDAIYKLNLKKSKRGVIPSVVKLDDFQSIFPNLTEELKKGKTIYMHSHCAYLGTTGTEGPYCEQEVFNCEYVASNNSEPELLLELEKAVSKKEETAKKLIKIGEFYE